MFLKIYKSWFIGPELKAWSNIYTHILSVGLSAWRASVMSEMLFSERGKRAFKQLPLLVPTVQSSTANIPSLQMIYCLGL